MKFKIAIVVTAGMVLSCFSCRTAPPGDTPKNSPTQPTTAPEPIDGAVNYPAQQTIPTVFAIKLPHGSDVTKIVEVDVWANTDEMEGRRISANDFRCDKVQLVNDEQAHSVILSGDIFHGMLNGDKDGQIEVTKGQCVGDGDVFTVKDTDSDRKAFDALAAEAAEGTIFIKLVRQQPDPINQVVLSAKVKIVLK